MFQLGEGRVDLFVLVEGVLSSFVDHFVTDGIFANLALKRLITVVKTVGGLVANGLAPEPALEALEVDKFDSSHAETDVEERVASGLN